MALDGLVSCETCKRYTENVGTRRCNLCWEVEGRLRAYVESPGGRARLAMELSTWDHRNGKCLLCDWAYVSAPCANCPDPAEFKARRRVLVTEGTH